MSHWFKIKKKYFDSRFCRYHICQVYHPGADSLIWNKSNQWCHQCLTFTSMEESYLMGVRETKMAYTGSNNIWKWQLELRKRGWRYHYNTEDSPDFVEEGKMSEKYWDTRQLLHEGQLRYDSLHLSSMFNDGNFFFLCKFVNECFPRYCASYASSFTFGLVFDHSSNLCWTEAQN